MTSTGLPTFITMATPSMASHTKKPSSYWKPCWNLKKVWFGGARAFSIFFKRSFHETKIHSTKPTSEASSSKQKQQKQKQKKHRTCFLPKIPLIFKKRSEFQASPLALLSWRLFSPKVFRKIPDSAGHWIRRCFMVKNLPKVFWDLSPPLRRFFGLSFKPKGVWVCNNILFEMHARHDHDSTLV